MMLLLLLVVLLLGSWDTGILFCLCFDINTIEESRCDLLANHALLSAYIFTSVSG